MNKIQNVSMYGPNNDGFFEFNVSLIHDDFTF